MEANALAPTRIRKPETRVARSSTWTPEEDEMLTQLVQNSTSYSWSVLATYFPNKTAPQLTGRWEKVINPQLVKGSWTREEDEQIIRYVQTHGDKDWAKLALILKGRTGKQCRERFKNHLDTSVKHSSWTQEEDNKLVELHNKFGNQWTKISSFFDGRTDNCIKNRWNSTIKKRLERIQKGEPLVMKRGRKPKNSIKIPAPMEIPSTEPDVDLYSSCSSPIVSHVARPAFPQIELIPITTAFIIKPENNGGRIKMPSLAQNRIDLQKMLNDLA
ncbi:Myb-like DNA-binding domain containing protein [Tritrichomonas foetus]|uniref:Myb-like DNA-binding domain containing protein n=1 Tax=Tritrichomonas foetus TaxID=1144522 RepID=A0A1J4JE57_9EUKA|nr:Myb-like DNA-binding domain containing protein [Tritrichomonas foetus]|eukprot:OHS97486.1 Myb-like DNA-binding domain containing protein [Tritrichomonas foetus]